MAPKKVGKKPDVKKTRKQLRKEDRKNKKIRRNEYYTKRKKPGQFVLLTDQHRKNMEKDVQNDQQENKIKEKPKVDVKNKVQVLDRKVLTAEDFREKERKQQMKLQKEMNKQRKKQLLQANLEEDRNIKQLEKQLKLNKRKSKSIPTSFATDGLDYLLEACDLENMKSSALAEQQLTEVNDEFEEDLVLMTETGSKHANKVDKEKHSYSSEDDQSYDDSDGDSSEDETSLQSKKRSSKLERGDNKKQKISSEDLDDDLISEDGDEDDSQNNISDDDNLNDISDESDSQNDISDDVDNLNDVSDDDNNQDEFSDNDDNLSNESITENDSNIEGNDLEDSNGEDENITQKKNDDGTWEDIYGRLRAKDGTIMTSKDQKYVPPAVRMKMETGMDKIRNEKLNRLKKQLKGLLNRLAESNMHSIAKQIEELYMNNSRNDMNNTITNLIVEALVSNIIAPERLLMEHVMLVAILHANVGTEVGAHFLQTVVKLFDEHCKTTNAENKMLDNVVIILAQLYNFKLFDSKLIYEILEKLTKNFEEKDVECILHMLRNVGFNLRKDNPMALKNLILSLQKQASGASDEMRDNSRVKFMLDVLLAIKNNNVTKIPNYDTSYSEHLKKIMKGFIRKGNYVTQLNISLEDLLKAEEKGKWWVVGSAWTGNNTENSSDDAKQTPNSFSQKLLQLAAKQRMNTDTRKNIFCIIMSAEVSLALMY
jgi:nucleolar MIF4G domain-containing protein 1